MDRFLNNIKIYIEKLKRDIYSPLSNTVIFESIRNKEKIINFHPTHARTDENVWKSNVFIHILNLLGRVVMESMESIEYVWKG